MHLHRGDYASDFLADKVQRLHGCKIHDDHNAEERQREEKLHGKDVAGRWDAHKEKWTHKLILPNSKYFDWKLKIPAVFTSFLGGRSK